MERKRQRFLLFIGMKKEVKHFFLGMTDKYSGVYVYSENEVEIVNPNINFRTIYLSGHLPGVFHWALIEKNLLDEVIDGNSELTKNFLDILRSENVIDW